MNAMSFSHANNVETIAAESAAQKMKGTPLGSFKVHLNLGGRYIHTAHESPVFTKCLDSSSDRWHS